MSARETESVKKYLCENKDILYKYFSECSEELKDPNYSEFMRLHLLGTTKEGVNFASIRVERGILTKFLRETYKFWLLTGQGN